MWMPYHCQLVHGWTSLGLKTNIVAVIVIVPAILWVVPRYGIEGAAWLWVVLNTGYLFIPAQIMFRFILTKEKWLWYRVDILFPTTAAFIIMCLMHETQLENSMDRVEWSLFLAISLFLAFVSSVFVCKQIRSIVLSVFLQKTSYFRGKI